MNTISAALSLTALPGDGGIRWLHVATRGPCKREPAAMDIDSARHRTYASRRR
ncbi:MAG: hypothetical protein Q8K45_17570 [Rubrivivax sp.]|nr:hypothetical protein [Rubrivivax sp.]